MKNKFTLGFSPCPNDTFIFDAIINKKIDTEGIEFDFFLADVETLNNKIFNKEPDIAKLSYHAYAYAAQDYVLLTAGSAIGNGCGPILISKENYSLNQIEELSIAIPGKYTTANLLLSHAVPEAKNKIEMLFSEIEDAVLNDSVMAGLIIHENRFTYRDKGLLRIVDLGIYWEWLTNLPIPLGGIAIKRDIDKNIQIKINRILQKSVEFALANPDSSMDFVAQHAQSMKKEVMQKHIKLYVNDFTVDLGDTGKNAIKTLFTKSQEINLIPYFEINNIFI
jgi:1,4-dihydroxy-6-naphthoate synthase